MFRGCSRDANVADPVSLAEEVKLLRQQLQAVTAERDEARSQLKALRLARQSSAANSARGEQSIRGEVAVTKGHLLGGASTNPEAASTSPAALDVSILSGLVAAEGLATQRSSGVAYYPPNSLKECAAGRGMATHEGLLVVTAKSCAQACERDPSLALQVTALSPVDSTKLPLDFEEAFADFRMHWLSEGLRKLFDLDSDLAVALEQRNARKHTSAFRAMLADTFHTFFRLKDFRRVAIMNVIHHTSTWHMVCVHWYPCVVEQDDGSRHWGTIGQFDCSSQDYVDRVTKTMFLEHLALKYSPTLITMVDAEGQVVYHNSASVAAFGIHASFMHVDDDSAAGAGQAKVNFLAELITDKAMLEEMFRLTAQGDVFRSRVQITSTAILGWFDLKEGVVWHDVQISRARDVDKAAIYIVAQVDVTEAVLLEFHIKQLQEQERSLLSSILPQQVIDVLLRPIGEVAEHRLSPSTSSAASSSKLLRPASAFLGRHLTPSTHLHTSFHQRLQENRNLLNLMQGVITQMAPHAVAAQRQLSELSTYHEHVTILFSDIQGFTSMSERCHPQVLLIFLNELYSAFDKVVDAQGPLGVYKVETIGDSYMVCAGLFHLDAKGNRKLGGFDPQHAEKVVAFARAMARAASHVMSPLKAPVEMRIGIHSGSCMSGVVGHKMPRFCLFGDTVNTASRMESTGIPGRVQVSQATRDLLPDLAWEATGGINVKGKGVLQTYLLAPEPPEPPAHQSSLAALVRSIQA